jgi:hypothetical protein
MDFVRFLLQYASKGHKQVLNQLFEYCQLYVFKKKKHSAYVVSGFDLTFLEKVITRGMW